MGTLIPTLQLHTHIAVDTAPFIYLWEQHPRYFALSEGLFWHLKTPKVHGFTSIITLIEVCVYPQRQGRMDLVATYENALFNSEQVQMLPVDVNIARRAMVLRAKYNIRVPDALHLATAIESGATMFVRNDKRLQKVEEIKGLVLDDYIVGL